MFQNLDTNKHLVLLVMMMLVYLMQLPKTKPKETPPYLLYKKWEITSPWHSGYNLIPIRAKQPP